jgi:hypothetical protein
MKLSGSLISDQEFISHHVLVSYTTQDGDDVSTQKSSEMAFKVASNGTFDLDLPDKDKLVDVLILEVVSPDGEVLTERKWNIEQIPDNIKINCDPKKYFPVPDNNDPSLGKRIRIVGKVLDKAGLRKISNTQVILYGFSKDGDSKSDEVILATTTDSEGYFSGDHPRDNNYLLQKYSKAYGVVAGAKNQQVPIIIDQDGLVSKKVILVIEFPQEKPIDRAKDDCKSLEINVPRAPDVEDFINSPNSFTTDLGSGKCVDLTVPNRSIEEFDFYTVIRTTEPEIFGIESARDRARYPERYVGIDTPEFVDAKKTYDDAKKTYDDAKKTYDDAKKAADDDAGKLLDKKAKASRSMRLAAAKEASSDTADAAVVSAERTLKETSEAFATAYGGLLYNFLNPEVRAAYDKYEAAKAAVENARTAAENARTAAENARDEATEAEIELEIATDAAANSSAFGNFA